MKTAVDTNVLLDLLAGDPAVAASARRVLSTVLSAGPVVICMVVYAELSAGFASHEDLTRFTRDLQLRVEDFSTNSLVEAASAWRRYTTQRSGQVQCPQCGQRTTLHCPACHAPLAWRQHIIADFLIGGHAYHQADQLLTRDRGYFRAYFPSLRLTAPPPVTP